MQAKMLEHVYRLDSIIILMLAKVVERGWIEDIEDIWAVSQQALQAQTTLVNV